MPVDERAEAPGNTWEYVMERIAESLCQLVGSTPVVRLTRFARGLPGEVLAKMESMNPLASVKDRIGLAMIEQAEKDGRLEEGGTIIEPTSGNTGIALAWVARVKGYRAILTMPDTMSQERRKLLEQLGTEIVLTPGALGMQGAIDRAQALAGEIEGAFIPDQFENAANPAVHYRTTGPEIWRDTGGRMDFFVAGVGTGGTITGAGGYLKERKHGIRVVAVEPEDSPVLSGGKPGPHLIEGIGAGFVPGVYDEDVADEIIRVSSDDAIAAARRLARTEGVVAGISSGASVHAARQIASQPENRGRQTPAFDPISALRNLAVARLWLRFRALTSGRIRASGSVGVYEMGSSARLRKFSERVISVVFAGILAQMGGKTDIFPFRQISGTVHWRRSSQRLL
jgi:cysteine synthase A